MKPAALKATVINILGNTLLFCLKLWVALLSGSVALLSDAFNSLTDIISAVAVFVCVRVSGKKADEGHPFGHSRAEPIAAIIVAILAGILGFEIIRESVGRLVSGGGGVVISPFVVAVPLITAAVKLLMFFYFRGVGRRVKSPAIEASAVDSFCDVFAALAALLGLLGVYFGYPFLDPLAGLLISLWIIYTGYSIGVKNIDYLMGKSPGPELTSRIEEAARKVEGVVGTNTLRAHYVGHYVHVELHVEVPKDISTWESHGICERVEKSIERIEEVGKAFIHIDPV
ncbi:Cobalt-zinc-cadmium resistance protein [hydrothermal vent metagenome]|uniref:Cobalt-zinc-cadmium resistance protein n=1 Tax=hydrothermal vent metagenome TaxID=652676 RepID=A0A3B0V199_9ZZZZ